MKGRKRRVVALLFAGVITPLALLTLGVVSTAGEGSGAKKRSWTAPPEAKAKENPVSPTPESLEAGKDLYDEHCSMCHGEKGKGDGPMADTVAKKPGNLSDTRAIGELTDGEIFWRISNGDDVMPSFEKEKPLSEKERWELVNYVRKLAGLQKKK